MKNSSFRFIPSLLLATLLFAPVAPVNAAEQATAPATKETAADAPLVIAGGKLPSGKPATVRNVIALVRERYPDANINVVGVDDVLIQDLTLHWGIQREERAAPGELRRRINPPLQSVLFVIAQAGAPKIAVRDFGPNNFLVHLSDEYRHHPGEGAATVEVFNLAAIFPQTQNRAQLEARYRELQLQFSIAAKRYKPDQPEMAALADNLELTKALFRQSEETSFHATEDRLTGIKEAVSLTLSLQSPGEEPPQFKFHRGTNLLIATGSAPAIAATRKVLAAMREKQ